MGSDTPRRQYDTELEALSNVLVRMGGMAEQQLAQAIQAVMRRDSDLAGRVVAADTRVDDLEREVHQEVIRLLALRQPVAADLRRIVAALKISSDIERFADYAKNIAKRAFALNQIRPVAPVNNVPRMARVVQELMNDVLDAFVEGDVDRAVFVWQRDEEVDEIYTSLFREVITYMMEDPRNIAACTHLLFIAKNIERMGDHTTNIAETIHFLITGEPLAGTRPKGDQWGMAASHVTMNGMDQTDD